MSEQEPLLNNMISDTNYGTMDTLNNVPSDPFL